MNAQQILDRHGLRTRDITRRDLRRLREMFASAFRLTVTTSGDIQMSRGLDTEFSGADGQLVRAELRCSAAHFENRPVFTIERGRAFFGTWADETHLPAMRAALTGWASDRQRRKAPR